MGATHQTEPKRHTADEGFIRSGKQKDVEIKEKCQRVIEFIRKTQTGRATTRQATHTVDREERAEYLTRLSRKFYKFVVDSAKIRTINIK